MQAHASPWYPAPGTNGRIYALVWANGVAVRSPSVVVRYPIPPTILCPDIVLPRPSSPVEAADYGETAINDSDNALVIRWRGREYQVPLTTDPTTCQDEQVANQLRFAQEQTGVHTEGMFSVLLQFSRERHGEDVWIAQAELMGITGNQAVLDVRVVTTSLDNRQYWRYETIIGPAGGGWIIESVEPQNYWEGR